MKNKTDKQLAEILWNYNNMHMPLGKADVIMVMGSHDIQVADRGAELFNAGFAPLLVMSGGLGKLTSKMFNKPEANLFAERAINLGVPGEKILIENQSANTGQNVEFTHKLLADKEVDVNKIIVVQKPYMERRAFATFRKVWPEPEVIVTSPQISFSDYKSAEVNREEMVHIMVGDTERIKLYPEKGFQIPQEIPDEVWQAYKELVKRGYVNHLIKE